VYKDVFRQVQRGKILEQYLFMGKYYLMSPDGTGYFASKRFTARIVYRKVRKWRNPLLSLICRAPLPQIGDDSVVV